ncbi:arsenical resistance protein ArsH [Thalassococcus sp. S3]|uniref:arsenical resistance protein ArsH n=1 Tax=Thalassococcus sp. S3 TaxID=2017482 RepID=UPI0010247B87|nr:arsenical resistance protein ArsH [Thalassococcus sp. S3]QBF30936.1 arsenical resistance protein ArsH [Thalassococcus sp. S3]
MTEELDLGDLPEIVDGMLQPVDIDMLAAPGDPRHKPRILLLYGSLREVSYSRKAAEEAARVLRALGCETRIYDPAGLPLVDDADADHPKVAELRELATWSEGMVWSSPERHGAMTGVMKTQIDWLPLSMKGGIRPTQGKTLAVMQVSGGSQSFNAVNQMRILGRWMRMVTIPNQSSIPKAWLEFGQDGRLPNGPLYRRIVDVMEELVKFTWMLRGRKDYLVDRYSERVESAEDVHKRVSLKGM